MISVRQKATLLRDKGYSYNMIKEELGVAVSTQSTWFSGRSYKPNEIASQRVKNGSFKSAKRAHDERVKRTLQIINDSEKEIGELSKRDLWMLGVGIYMGEGSKSIESVRIVNSDPDIIRLAMKWFRVCCGLSDENFALSLHLYPDSNEIEAQKYWRTITNLPHCKFKSTYVDKRINKKQKMSGKLPHGTLQIRINANGNSKNGVELFRKIKGWTKGVTNQV